MKIRNTKRKSNHIYTVYDCCHDKYSDKFLNIIIAERLIIALFFCTIKIGVKRRLLTYKPLFNLKFPFEYFYLYNSHLIIVIFYRM